MGHNLTSIQHVKDNTMQLPAYPFDGRHIIDLAFFDKIVKPFGIKFEFDHLAEEQYQTQKCIFSEPLSKSRNDFETGLF